MLIANVKENQLQYSADQYGQIRYAAAVAVKEYCQLNGVPFLRDL